MCHVTMTLRSCDFFGRVMSNPQEVMMALSPKERPIHTHTHAQGGGLGQTGLTMSCFDFKDLCFIEIHNLGNHKAILVLQRNTTHGL